MCHNKQKQFRFFILSGIKRTENVENPINLSGSSLKSILKHTSKE